MNLLFFSYIGACFGSFIHASATRYSSTYLSHRSCCDHCHHLLSYSELIPLVSYILLKGKCSYCRQTISPSTFLYEVLPFLLTGYLIYNHLPFITLFTIYLLLYCAKVDWDCYTIPDRTHIFIFLLFILSFFFSSINLPSHLIAALLYTVPLSFFAIKKWIGWGDVKLLFFLGLLIEFLIIPTTFIACFFCLLNSFKTKRNPIPFAPYLCAGFILSTILSFY